MSNRRQCSDYIRKKIRFIVQKVEYFWSELVGKTVVSVYGTRSTITFVLRLLKEMVVSENPFEELAMLWEEGET